MDHERGALIPSPRIRTAPQFPHLHSTVGLGVSSAGGAVGTASTSGAGTTLSVLCGRAGIAATNSKSDACGLFIMRSIHLSGLFI